MNAPVSIEREGPVMRVCLDRPDKLNAFSAELVEGLHAAVLAAVQEEVRLLVFTGSGKGFSGGFDLSGLQEMSDEDLVQRFVRVEELMQAVCHAPFGTMALVHGPCYGAAADLVAACQWRVAAPDARFRMPGLNFGIVLGTNRLTKLVGADAAHALLLRAKPFDANEAADCKFIQDIAERSAWPEAESRALEAVLTLSAANFAAMTERTRQSDRKADMAALLRSASTGSIKERIQAYLDTLASSKTAKS
ncbi:MAG: enoyl-CoA hydratase/isomerase family protein [Alphaproteobacteria bacterium]|nr:enoyl-CoA hydratase/isomerase family protein [Alphaproteobacteria bacterium]